MPTVVPLYPASPTQQTIVYLQALSVSSLNSVLTAWFLSLPTTLPSTSGIVWNNNGVICVS